MSVPYEEHRPSYWADVTGELRGKLGSIIPNPVLRELHRPRPVLHFLVLGWQILLVVVGVAGAWSFDRWYLWLPFSVALGFTFFNFTVMLHEVVHEAVFARRRWDQANGWLGYLYAFPSGISRTQFTRWHLDHHAQLGDAEADPKRHHLSPKRNARWYKLLYMTPALFFIYFRAAARENVTYPEELRRQIARERTITLLGQFAILVALIVLAGWWTAFKVYMVPYFIVFPVAFTLNRLGQHYYIDPRDPAKWSTLMARSRFWDVAFLWSSYHLEHHYFPRVPFYNLRRLNGLLETFYEEIGLKPTTYTRLLWHWFVLNKVPHTDWSVPHAEGEALARAAS